MKWKFYLGKIIGAILGWLSGLGVFGILFGLLLGHFIDILIKERKTEKEAMKLFTSPNNSNLNREIQWLGAVTGLCLAVAADRGLSLQEVEKIKKLVLTNITLSTTHLTYITTFIENYLHTKNPNIDGLIDLYISFNNKQNSTIPLKPESFLALLFDCALINGTITTSQKKLIRTLSDSLNIPQETYKAVKSQKMPKPDIYHYHLLGITEKADINEIRKVYRTLAAQFHPDQLNMLDHEQQNQAKEAFLKIKTAHDIIIQEKSDD